MIKYKNDLFILLYVILHNKMSLDYLAKKNAHERDSHITFDEGPHIYTIDGDSGFTSVTTWNHSHFEHFDADAIIANMMRSPNWQLGHKYYGMTPDEIKASWDKNRDEAAAAGAGEGGDGEASGGRGGGEQQAVREPGVSVRPSVYVLCMYPVCIPFDGTGEMVCILSISLSVVCIDREVGSLSVCAYLCVCVCQMDLRN